MKHFIVNKTGVFIYRYAYTFYLKIIQKSEQKQWDIIKHGRPYSRAIWQVFDTTDNQEMKEYIFKKNIPRNDFELTLWK